MTTHFPVDIIRVFANPQNMFGNPVGIVIDVGKKINAHKRQHMAQESGLSETVFINDIQSGNVSIYNPQDECPFAMHATLGTVWYIRHILHTPLNHIESNNERMIVWESDDNVWVRARLDVIPSWNLQQLNSTTDIENMNRNKLSAVEHSVVWAWIDKDKGMVRARTFAPDWGIAEDEANGSGAMRLAEKLQTKLTVLHGKGSIIYAHPYGSTYGEVGGRCILT